MSHSRFQRPPGSGSGSGTGMGDELPQIAALYLVKFDVREGYKLIWSKSITNIELEGVVEFKCLPSGLHNVRKDLVYFVHDDYAAVSAFVNVPGDDSQRNAQMLSVGVSVPLSYGRLGKGWRHAGGLQQLAEDYLSTSGSLDMLEQYWENHRISGAESGSNEEPNSPVLESTGKHTARIDGYRRNRAVSGATTVMTLGQNLLTTSSCSLFTQIDRRIWTAHLSIVPCRPASKACLAHGQTTRGEELQFWYLYNLSILSSVPISLLSLLPVDSIPPLRLRPLFNVGILDIPTLTATSSRQSNTNIPSSEFSPSWIACTTDDVLATKPQLYDILVNFPPSSSIIWPNSEKPRPYPSIHPSSRNQSGSAVPNPHLLKATQRDLRRYVNLRSDLQTLPSAKPPPEEPEGRAGRDYNEADIGSDDESTASSKSTQSTLPGTDEVVEATPWAQIAYTSFIWWASAGEKRTGLGVGDGEEGEDEQDRALLMSKDQAQDDGFSSVVTDGAEDSWGRGNVGMCRELAIVRYFHRLTGLIFATISDAISRVDGEEVRRGEAYGRAEEDSEANMRGPRSQEESPLARGEENGADVNETDEDEDEEDDEADETIALLPPKAGENSFLDQATVVITSDDMEQMGLDVWSRADRDFVVELIQLWWGRTTSVTARRIECCGVRVL